MRGRGRKTNVHAPDPKLASCLRASCGDLFVCVLVDDHGLGVCIGRPNTVTIDPYVWIVPEKGTGASAEVSILTFDGTTMKDEDSLGHPPALLHIGLVLQPLLDNLASIPS